MAKKAIERLVDAIGYPDRVPDGAQSFTLRADGAEILAEESSGRIVLSHRLTDDESRLPSLAAYAAGRMLREDATLSFGQPGLSVSGLPPAAFLWQDAPATAGAHDLLRLFETFMDSCDWWRERVEGQRASAAGPSDDSETMVIRP